MKGIQNKIKRLFDLLVSIVVIYITAPFLLLISIAIKLTSLGPVFFNQERLGKDGKIFKILIFDVLGSIVVIYMTDTFLLLVSTAIKLTSRGSVFFKQERLGKDGKIFKILKFRTMVDNAVNIGSGLSSFEGDPRVTKVGSF